MSKDGPPVIEKLIKRTAGKDERAFRELYEESRDRLWSFLLRMTGPANAEDLLQEVYVRVWRFAGGYNGGEPFAWLYRIARNAALSHLRKKGTRQMVSIYDDRRGSPAVNRLTNGNSRPEESALRNERALQVQDALGRLPVEQREVIVMKEFQKMKFDEIAVVLDCPVGTVKSRMRYGTMKLAELLKELA